MLAVKNNKCMNHRTHVGSINLPHKQYLIINNCNNSTHNKTTIEPNKGTLSYGLSGPNIENSPPNLFLQNIETRMIQYYETK